MATNGKLRFREPLPQVTPIADTSSIDRLIIQTRRLLRSTWTTKGLSITTGMFVTSLLVVTLVDLALPLPTTMRIVAWAIVFGSGTIALVAGVVLPLLRRLTAVKVARQIESHLPGIHNRLVSCVELENNDHAGHSPVFHRRLVKEALSRIRGFQPGKVIDKVGLKRAAMFAGGGVLAMFLAAIIFGDRMPTAVARVFRPLADIPPNSGVSYNVLIEDRAEPGDCSILRGEDVAFTVVLREGRVDPPGGADPLRLKLNVVDPDEGRRTVWYDFGPLQDDLVTLTLNEMQHSCSYRVFGGGTWSKEFSIELLDRPRIVSQKSLVRYPEYMRIAEPQASAEESVDVSGPQGSQVELLVDVAGDAVEGEIEMLKPDAVNGFTVVRTISMTPTTDAHPKRERGTDPSLTRRVTDMQTWRGAFELNQDGFYRVVFRNKLEYANRQMKEGKITALPDNAPQVVLERPTEDIVVAAPIEIPVQAAAFDDFGLDNITMVAEHSYWGESREVRRVEESEHPARDKSNMFVLNLADQRLRRGDQLKCWIEATDTKGQTATSDSFSVRVANEREAADRQLADFDDQLDNVRAMLDSLVREQTEAHEILEQLAGQQPAADRAFEAAPLAQGEIAGDDNPFSEEREDDSREQAEQENDDDLWERDERLEQLANLEQQNAELAEQVAEALREAVEQAEQLQLLPQEIGEQLEGVQQAFEPAAMQPLQQLEQMASEMSQQAQQQQEQPEDSQENSEVAAAERLSDHLQDNLEDLRARMEAIAQAQQESRHDLEEALANFEEELTQQNAEAAERELSELRDFVDELREDLGEHQDTQEELIAHNAQQPDDSAFEQLAEQQEDLNRDAADELQQARELLDNEAIDDLSQQPPESFDDPTNPFEQIESAHDAEEGLWEDTFEEPNEHGDEGPHEQERREEEPFGHKNKEPAFEPALDKPKSGKKEHGGHEPFFEEEPGPAESAPSEPGSESENWEDAFESPEENNSRENDSEPSGSEPANGEPASNAPRARFAQDQRQQAEQLSQAEQSLAADQETLNELLSELAEAQQTQEGQQSQSSSPSQSASELSELLNSPSMQQALAMQQRMNRMLLPAQASQQALANLSPAQNQPEGARAMRGAVEQIMVELGDVDPTAASLLMRMQPQEREEILQGLRQGGPKGYRKLIRDYFVRLSQAGAR
jgi:hypothetical protein